MPSIEDVTTTIEACLSTWKGGAGGEVAFYGGSFTALPREAQSDYLRVAGGYIRNGLIDSIRVSTRPDRVTEEDVSILRGYGVATVELGAQSMSDTVLGLSGRGHTAAHIVNAVHVLKGAGVAVGLQFMPGLPGDTEASVLRTTEEIIALSPGFVRVYPTLVLRDTPLYRMYREGGYAPWDLDRMAGVCARLSAMLKEACIPVIRMGLHPSASLVERFVAGPFHPSFRQIVERRISRDKQAGNG
jgi:histone acetyltransferase (RNA polymerase elongator complex component)